MLQLLDELRNVNKIAIGGHTNPDGDCIGACMGMYLFLKHMLPEAIVDCYLEQPASVYRCISGVEQVKTAIDDNMKYDVFIALDCDKTRLDFSLPLFEQAKKTINIDHHISNAGTGDINWINPSASAASEMVYELIHETYMDDEIAKALYMGIIHDCGVFQYSNTTKRTMQIGADLIQYQFDFSALIEETFYEKSYVQNQITGRALLESILFMDGKCIVSVIDKKTMEFYQVNKSDLSGIVSQLRYTKGVECAIFMYETGPLTYKVSMRSTDKVNVAEIAAVFGGGGHKKAAGCTMNGTVHDNINNLSQYIAKQLNY